MNDCGGTLSPSPQQNSNRRPQKNKNKKKSPDKLMFFSGNVKVTIIINYAFLILN